MTGAKSWRVNLGLEPDEEIIEMADECGLAGYFELDGDSVGQLMVTAFAKLIVERERKRILDVIGNNQCECRCSEVVRGQA